MPQLLSFNFQGKLSVFHRQEPSKRTPIKLPSGTIIISQEDFIKFLEAMGNTYEFVELYD